jgi:hypothetical protein
MSVMEAQASSSGDAMPPRFLTESSGAVPSELSGLIRKFFGG